MNAEKPKSLVIDVANFNDEGDLLRYLITAFDFPNLYEANWHGFCEHLFYDSSLKIPKTLHIKGIDKLKTTFPDCAAQFLRCIGEHLEPRTDCNVEYD